MTASSVSSLARRAFVAGREEQIAALKADLRNPQFSAVDKRAIRKTIKSFERQIANALARI